VTPSRRGPSQHHTEPDGTVDAADIAVLLVRNLVHISREPFQLSDVTTQPVLFTLMFVYVFGAGLVFNQVTVTLGTGVGLSPDVSTGLAIGWSPHGGVAHVAAAFALVMLFAYAVSRGCACRGPARRWACSYCSPCCSCATPWSPPSG
jgi:hypothetical protein